jgi:hypothetical protein
MQSTSARLAALASIGMARTRWRCDYRVDVGTTEMVEDGRSRLVVPSLHRSCLGAALVARAVRSDDQVSRNVGSACAVT